MNHLPPIPWNNIRVISNFECCWYRWQIMGKISDYWHLKVNFKEKNYLYFYSPTQRCPKKSFPFAAGVKDTGGAPWAANISANFRKFETALMVNSRALGKLIHDKNLKSKISWHCPFKSIVIYETLLLLNLSSAVLISIWPSHWFYIT